MVNIGSLSTGGRVLAVKADLAKIALTTPVCTEVLEKIALSRRWGWDVCSNFINFVFQDRQALEVDRLGSDPKRHSRETDGTFLGIQQWPASPPWWCHPLYMSRGQNQFISKASKGLLDIHRATFFKNLALYNTLVTSREEHSWHEQCSSVGVTLLFFLQEPWHLCP